MNSHSLLLGLPENFVIQPPALKRAVFEGALINVYS